MPVVPTAFPVARALSPMPTAVLRTDRPGACPEVLFSGKKRKALAVLAMLAFPAIGLCSPQVRGQVPLHDESGKVVAYVNIHGDLYKPLPGIDFLDAPLSYAHVPPSSLHILDEDKENTLAAQGFTPARDTGAAASGSEAAQNSVSGQDTQAGTSSQSTGAAAPGPDTGAAAPAAGSPEAGQPPSSSQQTSTGEANGIPPIPDGAKQYTAKGTGYFPDNSPMEGGFQDRKGNPLHTLQDYLAGKAPYVSVAMDSTAFDYGTKLRIPELEKKYGRLIDFRVVDTGGAFKGKGTTRIDICTASQKDSVDATINGQLTLIPI